MAGTLVPDPRTSPLIRGRNSLSTLMPLVPPKQRSGPRAACHDNFDFYWGRRHKQTTNVRCQHLQSASSAEISAMREPCSLGDFH